MSSPGFSDRTRDLGSSGGERGQQASGFQACGAQGGGVGWPPPWRGCCSFLLSLPFPPLGGCSEGKCFPESGRGLSGLCFLATCLGMPHCSFIHQKWNQWRAPCEPQALTADLWRGQRGWPEGRTMPCNGMRRPQGPLKDSCPASVGQEVQKGPATHLRAG